MCNVASDYIVVFLLVSLLLPIIMLFHNVYFVFAKELPTMMQDWVDLKQNVFQNYGGGHFVPNYYANFVEGDGWNPIEGTTEALSLP